MVFAAFYNGSLPTTCEATGTQKLAASIRQGSVTNASLVEVFSPIGPGTPLCDSYGTSLQALLLTGEPGQKLTVDFVVDVAPSSPGVTRLAIPIAGYVVVPEPSSFLLLVLGLKALHMRPRRGSLGSSKL